MAYSQQDFLDAIYEAIDAACPEIEIFSTAIPPNEPMPYIVYSIIGDIPSIYFGNATDDWRVMLQVSIYDRRDGTNAQTGGMRELRLLGERVKASLHKKVISISNSGNCSGWCTRRGTCRNENDSVNSVTHEFVFIGSEL